MGNARLIPGGLGAQLAQCILYTFSANADSSIRCVLDV